MQVTKHGGIDVCLALTRAIGRAHSVHDIYEIALGTLAQELAVPRSAILLFDEAGQMRFVASHGLSLAYEQAVEGHTPWSADAVDPLPLVVGDVESAPSLAGLLPVIRSEGIAAMAFIPLVHDSRIIGTFMLYFDRPTVVTDAALELAVVIAAQVAFAVVRTRAEDRLRRSDEQLRFALAAAALGTWEWDFHTGALRWSETLERLHGLPPGGFDGSFASFEREIHPEDRWRVVASISRAVREGMPHEVEYRIVGQDGRVRWVEGKGSVEHAGSMPVRMSGVCMDITARKEAEAARLDAAHEANRLKDDFLAMLSHELRTPLSAIVGWVQVLEAGPLAPNRVQQALEIIGRNARLQARLIEDILDVSRIITGKLAIDAAPLLPSHLIDSAVSAIAPEASAHGIELTHVVPADLPPLEGDARRLQQVLGNLLSNAVKFTPEGGRILVACAADAGGIRVTVRDSGVGIAPEFLPHVFESFRQGDSQTTRRHGGLGLGLAVARYIVERHGGTIAASSDGKDRGTTMTVRLPGAAGATGRPRRDSALPERVVRLDQVRVLVVDDNADARHLLRTLIEASGGQVIDADGASSAMTALASTRPDVLVADLAMPDVDGFGLIAHVRRLYPDMPGVALTAHAKPEDRVRALEAGYSVHFTKPFDVHALVRCIGGLAAGRPPSGPIA